MSEVLCVVLLFSVRLRGGWIYLGLGFGVFSRLFLVVLELCGWVLMLGCFGRLFGGYVRWCCGTWFAWAVVLPVGWCNIGSLC